MVDFFDVSYSGKRIREIEDTFSVKLRKKTDFSRCPLIAIMQPSRLIRVDEREHGRLDEIAESYESTLAFCKDKLRQPEPSHSIETAGIESNPKKLPLKQQIEKAAKEADTHNAMLPQKERTGKTLEADRA